MELKNVKSENTKLCDNVLILQQKVTDFMEMQMIKDNPQKIKKSLGLKKTKSLKSVSIVDNKVS